VGLKALERVQGGTRRLHARALLRRGIVGHRAKLDIALNPQADPTDRLKAMESLEARALGRPKETVEHQVSPSQHVLDMSPEERAALSAAIARRRALDVELKAEPLALPPADPADGYA
jgi:hypothetical protein